MFQQNKNTISSIIGSDLELNGDINIKGDLLIYGTINGNIDCEGIVTTAKGSIINGNIKTACADVSGVINGNLIASEKVSLSFSSKLNGDLYASILVIEKGALFNGLCKMQDQDIHSSKNIKNQKITNLNERSK